MSGLLSALERWWSCCDGTVAWWSRAAWLAALALGRGADPASVDALMATSPAALLTTLEQVPLRCGSWACWLGRELVEGLQEPSWALRAVARFRGWGIHHAPCPGGALHQARQVAPWAGLGLNETLGWLREAQGQREASDAGWWRSVVWQVMALLEGEQGVDVLLDYLADHLGAALGGLAPCGCGSWRCWVRACPLEPPGRALWVSSLGQPRSAAPSPRAPEAPRCLLSQEPSPSLWPKLHPWDGVRGWLVDGGGGVRALGCAAAGSVEVSCGAARLPGGALVGHGAALLLDGQPGRFYAFAPPWTLEICRRRLSVLVHVPLREGDIFISRVPGRAPAGEQEVVLPFGNISKLHCRLTLQAGRCQVVDLKSSGGTYVNTRRITAPQVLEAGDELMLGDLGLRVRGLP